MLTTAVYAITATVSTALGVVADRLNRTGAMLVVGWLLLLLVITFGFRVDTGNDYAGYVRIFNAAQFGVFQIEPGFAYLNQLFVDSKDGHVFVLALAAALTYVALLVTLWWRGTIALGLFFAFTTGFVFLTLDQVRQGIALSIVLYSIRFIEERRLLAFITIISTAAILFHISAIACLLFYFIPRFRVPMVVWVLGLVVVYIASKVGIFTETITGLLGFASGFGEFYRIQSRFLEPESLSTGFATLFWLMNAIFVAFMQDRIKNRTIVNLYLFGMLLFFIVLEFHLLNRLAHYLFYMNLLVFPLLARRLDETAWEQLIIRPAWLASFVIFYSLTILLKISKHGPFPYDSYFL